MAPGFGFGYCMSPFWTAPSLGCMPMSFPGFYRSQINWDMVHEQGRYNIAANLMSETMNTNALMYQVRDLRYNQAYTNPYFGGFNLPNPKDYVAALQPQLNAMFTQFMNNINNQANAVNNNTVNNPNTGDPKKNECIRLRGILQDFQTLNNTKSIYGKGSATEEKIAAALKKTGTDDEILAALKDAVQYIATNYKDALRNMLLGKDGILGMLTDSGYNMSPSVIKADDQNETNENTLVGQVVNELKNCPETPDASYFAAALTVFKSDKEELILRRLSYLNDKTSADGKSYIQMLVDVNKNGKWKDNQNWQNLVKFSSESLINKGIKVATTITDADLKKKVEDAYGDLTAKKNAYVVAYDQAKATDFVKSFNNLYALLRLVTAQQAQNKVRTEYGYLNNTVTDLIDNDLIVKETKEDLAKEKIGTVPTVDLAKMRTTVEAPAADGAQGAGGGNNAPQTAQERADALVSSHDLDEFATVGDTKIYKTKTTSAITVCDPKFYAVTKDGKFVELKNVKSVNQATGKCKTLDNKEVELKDVKKEEINDEDVKNYRQLVLDLVSLTTGSKPKLTATPNSGSAAFKGVRLYKSSKGEYYMTINNKLAKLKNTVEQTGELKGTGVYIWELTADDESKYFEYVTKDSINGASQANRSNSVKFTLYSQDINNAVYAGYSMHYELNGNSNSGNYRNAKDEFDKFNKYKSASQVASFIEGFNKASGGVYVSAGCKICYQIFTEEGESGYFDENYRKNAVKNIVSKVRTYLIPRTNLDTELLQKAKETIENFDNENITNASCSKVDNAIQQIVDAYYKQYPNIKKHVKSY